MRIPSGSETPFGRWIRQQPKGAITAAMLGTGLAWTTVNKARRSLVSLEVAKLLSKHTRGAVKVADIAKPPRPRSPRAAPRRCSAV